MWKINRPFGVVVSICPVRERRAAPLPSKILHGVGEGRQHGQPSTILSASNALATSGRISVLSHGVTSRAKSTTPCSISKCVDRRGRTLLYEAADVMLTRCRQPLKLKAWALAIAKRSTMRKARIALARRLAIIMHAMLRQGTEFRPA